VKLILSTEFAPFLEGRLPTDIQVVWADQDGHLDGDAHDAEVYFNPGLLKSEVLDKILRAAPALRWQHTPSAGVNHLLTPTALAREIILTNSAGVHGIPIAEFVIALMLDHVKHLGKLHQLQAEHTWDRRWKDGIFLQELFGTTVLIIGTGGIGQAIAQRASAFGMRIWGSRKHPQPLPPFEKIVGATAWYDLLPAVDFVVLALPLTPETKGIVDAKVLRAMRRSAYLINIARGALVDETALFTALTEGWIAGAGIDAFVTEPLPPDSPLWSVPNLFVTPHTSWSSPHTRTRTVDLFLENLHRYRAGQPLRNVVNRHAGY
jgi:phosphoglycerate dehydrogenase-like enzyme